MKNFLQSSTNISIETKDVVLWHRFVYILMHRKWKYLYSLQKISLPANLNILHYLLTCLFMTCFNKPSVARTTQHQTVGWLANRCGRKESWVHLTHILPCDWREGKLCTTSPGESVVSRDLSPGPPNVLGWKHQSALLTEFFFIDCYLSN
jgi:hypothetical protein